MAGQCITCLAVLCMATVHGQLLSFMDNTGTEVWSDKGSWADQDFVVYTPTLPDNKEWKVIGHRAQANHNGLERPLMMVKPAEGVEGDAPLVPPVGFTFMWDDRGTTALKDGGTWRAQCPPDYVALGDFFYHANRVISPPDLYQQVGCVHEDLTEPCTLGRQIWKDDGSLARHYLSVWAVKNSENVTLDTGFFYGNQFYDQQPPYEARCLKSSSITEMYSLE